MARTTSKTIGVLTSGGDCAGLNAVIRAVVARAVRAMAGAVSASTRARTGCCAARSRRPARSAQRQTGHAAHGRHHPRHHQPRRSLRLSRCRTASCSTARRRSIEGMRLLGLDALIGIGGDGSLAILRRLAQQGGIPLVGIPKTIDNDVGATESFGRLPHRGRWWRPRRSTGCSRRRRATTG